MLEGLAQVCLSARPEKAGFRDRLVRDGEVVTEEEGEIAINVYLEQELRLMLELAGFQEVSFEAGYSGEPATADDADVVVVAVASPRT